MAIPSYQWVIKGVGTSPIASSAPMTSRACMSARSQPAGSASRCCAEHLIQMPTPLKIPAHVRYPLLSDLGGKHRAKPVPAKPDRLMADVDPALGQEILDVAQRQRVFHVHHHDQTDYFWRAVEISERVLIA